MASIAIIGARGIPKNFPGTSGIEAYIEQQLPLLTKSNSVNCYIHSWTDTLGLKMYHGAKIISIPTINTTYFDTILYSFFSTIHASCSNVDIIWYHGVGSAFFSFIPLLSQKKIYTTIHTREWERKKWSTFAKIFLRVCEIIALSCSSKIYVVSKNLYTYYKHAGILHVSVQRYRRSNRVAPRTNTLLKKYNLKKNTYVIYIGRFVPEKRIEWIIRASDSIVIPIVLVGGSSHSDSYVRSLKKLAFGRNIIFTDYLFDEQKYELLSNAKLFVLPSQTEGLPVSVIEALELKTPCLIGDFLKEEFSKKDQIHFFQTFDYDNFVQNLLLYAK